MWRMVVTVLLDGKYFEILETKNPFLINLRQRFLKYVYNVFTERLKRQFNITLWKLFIVESVITADYIPFYILLNHMNRGKESYFPP